MAQFWSIQKICNRDVPTELLLKGASERLLSCDVPTDELLLKGASELNNFVVILKEKQD